MNLGYSITSFHTADVPPREAARTVVERTQVAEEAGYDYVETGDHHVVTGGQYLQSVPTAGRLAEVSDHVAAMFLLPLYDPLLVAEQAGSLAAFADTFDLWVAVGGNPAAFEAYGVPMSERGARLSEGIELIDRLWSEDEVTFDGEFYSVDGVGVNPKAPDARICVGGAAQPAVRRAGRLGDAWVAGPEESPEKLPTKIADFEESGGGDVIVRREALVLQDGDRAAELADEKLRGGYRGWPADADWVLSGGPADVAEDLAELRDLGADEVVVRPMSGEHAEATLECVAEAREMV